VQAQSGEGGGCILQTRGEEKLPRKDSHCGRFLWRLSEGKKKLWGYPGGGVLEPRVTTAKLTGFAGAFFEKLKKRKKKMGGGKAQKRKVEVQVRMIT